MKSLGSTPRLALTAGLALGLLLPPPAVSAQSFGGFLRPTCGRPAAKFLMSQAGAVKVGTPEFANPNGTYPDKPRWYLVSDTSYTFDHYSSYSETCPGYSGGYVHGCQADVLSGLRTEVIDIYQTSTVHTVTNPDTGNTAYTYAGTYSVGNSHHSDQIQRFGLGFCPGDPWSIYWNAGTESGSGDLSTVNNQPYWSGSVATWAQEERDCDGNPIISPCDDNPVTGRTTLTTTGSGILGVAIPTTGIYQSPTVLSLASSTVMADCQGDPSGSLTTSGSISLSDEFTTLEMIILADQRADLTPAQVNAVPAASWSSVGSAFTLLNESEERVKLRKLWYFFEFDRLPNLAYTITWTEVTVALDGGVSENHRSWNVPAAAGGGYYKSPVFEVEQPYYNAVVFVVNERFCPEGAQDDTQCVNPLTRSSSPAAAGCCGGSSGLGGAELDGVSLSVSLGSTGYDEDAGKIRLQAHRPDATTPTAAALQVVNPAADTEVINDSNGDLAQVKSRQFLGHVRKISNTSVAVHLFPAGQISPTKVNGLYVTNGATETVAWIVAAPLAGQGDFNRITLTETTGPSSARTTQYDFEPAQKRWTMLSPDSLLKQRETMAWDAENQLLTKTYETLDPGTSQVTFREARVFHVFGAMDVEDPWVEPNPTRVELVEVRTGVGSEERVSSYHYDTYQYYLNRTEDWTGRWRTMQRTINASSGLDRPTVEREGYLDHFYAAFLGDNTLCRERVYSYDTVDYFWADDDGTAWPNLARKETESVLGQVVRQTQRIVRATGSPAVVEWVKEFQVPYADADVLDPGVVAASLVTKTTFYTTGAFAGRVKNVLAPDLTLTTYEYVDAGGNRTTTVRRGQPNGAFDAVTAGTQTVTVVAQDGRTLSSTTTVIGGAGNGLTTDSRVYSNFDSQGRAQTVTYLDTKTETYAYGCCGLDSFTAKDGTVTTYGYDNAKRRVSETTAGVTTLTDYDWAGHAWRTRRRGTDQSLITLSQSAYNTAGELVSTINQLGATTTYADTLVGGVRTRTTTEAVGLPEVATRIETYYKDGQLKETSGTGASPMRYEHGIETDNTGGDLGRLFQKTIRLATGGGTSEWTKSYTDFFGRGYKTIHADFSTTLADNPAELTEFNALGQVVKRVDPDGVTALFRYNAQGELEVTATDLNQDGKVANYDAGYSGTDRVTRTVTQYWAANAAPNNNQNVPLRRTEVSVLATDNSGAWTVVQRADAALNGLTQWSLVLKEGTTWVVSSNVTVYGTGGSRTLTSYAPGNTRTVQSFSNGRLTTVTEQNSAGGTVTQTTYQYDPHGRQWRAIDARNGTTTYAYQANTDLLATVTTPVPGTGEAAQTTTTVYDNLQRPKTLTQSDGTVVNREYFPTGLLKKTWGSRTYPVEYTYDAQGRMKTMKTWQNYAGNTGTATTTWNYNAYRGWLDNKRYQDNTGPDYTYTKAGRPKTRKWARTGTGGQKVTTTYKYGFDDAPAGNQFGELVEVAYSYDPENTPATTHTYDRRGRRKTTVRDGLTTTYAYNEASLPVSEAHTGGLLAGLTVTRGYDNYLRPSTLGANTATVISQSYGYDTAARLSTVTDGNYSATYAYHANSRLVSTVTSKHLTTTRLTVGRAYDKLNRLQSIQNTPAGANQLADLSAYHYNAANQRVRRTLGDGSFWVYEYDALGQVKSGKRYWSDGTPVVGQQFEYAFDDIGNRTGANGAKMGGDENGASLRSAAYTPNLLNQYASRGVPGYLEVLGLATASPAVDVSVNGSTAGVYERGEYFRKELTVANGSAPVWQSVTVSQNGGTATSGNALVPATPQSFTYDLDGNLLGDGLWNYTWDAENRLLKMESPAANPAASRRRLEFKYDALGRRIWKKVTKLSDSSVLSETRFLYDGWNLLAELSGASGTTTVRTYLWGSDLSGSLQGAGGVGGLLAVRPTSSGFSHFAGYDGNGNLTLLVDGNTGLASAAYEYGPFGEALRVTGPLAAANPFAFSTKFTDRESGYLYYGYRYYSPSLGRWLNRDPLEEEGGFNLQSFNRNNALIHFDALGLHAENCLSNCGADVTKSVITTLNYIEETWENAPSWIKWNACSALHDTTPSEANRSLPKAAGAWAIIHLGNAGICPELGGQCAWTFPEPSRPGDNSGIVGGCFGTVTFGGACYQARDVHYLMWGRVNKLCNKIRPLEFNLTTAFASVYIWKTVLHNEESYIPNALAFTEIGYQGIVIDHGPSSELFCNPSKDNRVPDYILPWRWKGLQE